MSTKTPASNGAINYAKTAKPAFSKTTNNTPDKAKEQRRESFMVKRDRPKPTLRPSPHKAYGPDKAAFNQRWNKEHEAAQQTTTREDRKAAFKAERSAQTQTRNKTHNR